MKRKEKILLFRALNHLLIRNPGPADDSLIDEISALGLVLLGVVQGKPKKEKNGSSNHRSI